MIPIGSRVRWAEALGAKSNWVGVVTGHASPRMVECDGRGRISVGLLEVVGMIEDDARILRELQDELTKQMARNYELITERDALADLVAQQCEMLAEMVPAPTEDELARLQEVEADFIRLRDAVGQHFFNVFGTHTPTSLDCRSAGVNASDLIAELARYTV